MAIVLDGTTGIVVSGNTNSFSGVYVGEGGGALDTNTAIGVSSLAANTTGSTNTALGASALAVNTSGSSNTAVGRDALQGSSTSSLHTAIGTSALYSNTSGAGNTAVGATSLYINTTGSFNVAMGVQALRYSETASGNTAVGYQAGYNNTTGTYGTYVGYGAGLSITTGNKNTIIGAYTGNNGGLDIRTSNNYIVLSDGDGNPRGVFDSSGNLGVGTTSPTGRLHLVNSAAACNLIIDGQDAANKGALITFRKGGADKAYLGQASTILGGGSTSNDLMFYAEGVVNQLFYTNAVERARITSDGRFLFGKTAAGAVNVGLEVLNTGSVYSSVAASTDASATYHVYSTTASTYRFYVGMSGTIYATSTVISSLSDQRFKENIRDLNAGLAEVMALKPRLYDWKEGKGVDIKNARGFIAQEFEEVFPDLIDTWKDPAPEGEEPYKSVRADLIPVLVKAIQEQQAIITQLQADVAALKA
jgi:hypothetical protein